MKYLKDENGSTLLLALIVISIFGITSVSILSIILNENNMSLSHERKTAAYYIARSGAVSVGKAIQDMDTKDPDETDELDNLIEKLRVSSGGIAAEVPEIAGLTEARVYLENESTIRVDAIGEFKGETRKVSQYIETEEVWQSEPGTGNIVTIDKDTAIYADGILDIKKNPKIDNKNDLGKIVLRSEANLTVEKENKKDKINVSLVEEERNYPNIDIRKLASLEDKIEDKSYSSTVQNISKSIVFENTTVTFDNTEIDNENKDIDLIVNNLKLSGNNTLNLNGSGKVRIHVKNELELSGLKFIDKTNKKESYNQVEIYYYGSSKLTIPENPHVYANIFVEKADVVLEGNAKLGLIYAPKSDITVNQNGFISKIIGKNITLVQNPFINKDSQTIDLPLQFMTYNNGGESNGTYERKVKSTYLK